MESKDIIQTRIGGLGSSDAKMVAKVGRNGHLSDSDKYRIAVMLGVEEQKQFSTMQTEFGKYIEDQIFEALKKRWPGIVSNPFYKSDELSEKYGFGVFNHIDYEIETDTELIWIENKATGKSIADTSNEYYDQLLWHVMLLCEKSKMLNKMPTMYLSHYHVEQYEYFDPEKLNVWNVGENYLYTSQFLILHNGLKVVSEALPTFHYEKKEELYADNLPAPLQEKMLQIADFLKQIDDQQKKVDEFKEQIRSVMEANNVKSIKNEYFGITYIAASSSTSIDSKGLRKDHPDIAVKYSKTSNRSSYVKLTVN